MKATVLEIKRGDLKETTVSSELCDALIQTLNNYTEDEALVKDKDWADIVTKYLRPFQDWLRDIRASIGTSLPASVKMTLSDLKNLLNDEKKEGVVIVESNDPNELRAFSKKLGDTVYESRRKTGVITPLVSFIFDEADEFMPSGAEGTYKDSSEIIEHLVRRGRKFGLGVGIATQRVRYLNTNIMSQPHTYFISKLPRATDQEVVAEAFGISIEMLAQTFKFAPGDWLLASYDATGMKAVPIPIHVEDANETLRESLKELTSVA